VIDNSDRGNYAPHGLFVHHFADRPVQLRVESQHAECRETRSHRLPRLTQILTQAEPGRGTIYIGTASSFFQVLNLRKLRNFGTRVFNPLPLDLQSVQFISKHVARSRNRLPSSARFVFLACESRVPPANHYGDRRPFAAAPPPSSLCRAGPPYLLILKKESAGKTVAQ